MKARPHASNGPTARAAVNDSSLLALFVYPQFSDGSNRVPGT